MVEVLLYRSNKKINFQFDCLRMAVSSSSFSLAKLQYFNFAFRLNAKDCKRLQSSFYKSLSMSEKKILVSDKTFKDRIHSAQLPALSPRQGDE